MLLEMRFFMDKIRKIKLSQKYDYPQIIIYYYYLLFIV